MQRYAPQLEKEIRWHQGYSDPAAYATIKGFEVMRMIRKRQCICLEPGEVRFVAYA